MPPATISSSPSTALAIVEAANNQRQVARGKAMLARAFWQLGNREQAREYAAAADTELVATGQQAAAEELRRTLREAGEKR